MTRDPRRVSPEPEPEQQRGASARYGAIELVLPGAWSVIDWQDVERSALAEAVTEAEAKIFAFALNVIADGHDLTERWSRPEHGVYELIYDGPTEGVSRA